MGKEGAGGVIGPNHEGDSTFKTFNDSSVDTEPSEVQTGCALPSGNLAGSGAPSELPMRGEAASPARSKDTPTIPGKKKIRVLIANPLPGKGTVTSMLQAERFVRRGAAYFDEQGRLVFRVNSTDRMISAELILLRNQQAGYALAISEGPMATQQEARHIPIAMFANCLKLSTRRGPGTRSAASAVTR